jgi:hypothetical protein
MHGECQVVSESLILELIFRKIEVVKRKSGHRLDDEKLPQDATSHVSPDIVNVAASLFFSRYLIFIVVLKCHLKFRWGKNVTSIVVTCPARSWGVFKLTYVQRGWF